MSILVICAKCRTQLRVDDKFAGKKGLCPKCKAPITVPSPDDVKIHDPDAAPAGKKSKTGRPSLKPLTRRKVKIKPTVAAAIAGGALATVVIAWWGGALFRENLAMLVTGLVLVSPPLVLAAYAVLRDDELEPYRGVPLWIRAGICSAVYASLWGAFGLLPPGLAGEIWNWFFLAPPFFVVGALAALGCLDLDFGTGFFHYSFYLLATISLRWLIGMPALWTASTAIAP